MDIQLATTSTLQGVVLDRQGRPAPRIPVWVRPKRGDLGNDIDRYALRAATDGNGQFAITGLPDVDVYLSAGSDYPTTEMPYRRVYYPMGPSVGTAAVFRLKPGEHRLPTVLVLDPALAKASVAVRVVHQKGAPGVKAVVMAFADDGAAAEFAKTDAHGAARIPCLRGLKYELEARTWYQRMPWRGNILKSPRSPVTCGDPRAEFHLILDHSARF